MSDSNARENVLQHANRLIYMDLALCGCGLAEESYDLVRRLLALTPYHQSPEVQKQVAALCGNAPAQHMILSMLTNAGLIEHGCVIEGSWLTDKGEWYLKALDSISDWDDIHVGLPLDGSPCTEVCWRAPVPV
ncbi:hypothetical protein, partial [Streptomyces sp. NPDC005877]|uniref:hypothetical protein n=1 Tax=Streptomyces sp. NPDC005877 TaxID=3155346 RepID=UPI0033DAC4D2